MGAAFGHGGQNAVTSGLGLFQRTFGVQLTPESPYTLAARLGLGEIDGEPWDDLEPSAFETADALEVMP